MRRRIALAVAVICCLVLFALVIWQGSFSFGSYGPANPQQTAIIWAVSTLVFLFFVTLAFMLVRTMVKLYIERQHQREGSRIRSKLIIGALALSLTPVLFSVLFSVYVLNRNLQKWFRLPEKNIELNLQRIDEIFQKQAEEKARVEADWLSVLPEVKMAAQSGMGDAAFFQKTCAAHQISFLTLHTAGGPTLTLCDDKANRPTVTAQAQVIDDGIAIGSVQARFPLDPEIATRHIAINRYFEEQRTLAGNKKFYQIVWFQLICVITLFVLFVASWISQILARQISVPISALLAAAKAVRQGNLSHRVRVRAMDEMATLVRSFNEMTSDLESNAKELEARRRFTEAILESIPTGVLSISADGRVERVNRAFRSMFPDLQTRHLEELFQGENLDEVRYLMKRARRTGAAGSQMEILRGGKLLHLSLTVSSLDERRGFVLVVEDTSELLRAQKAAAWQEVARRIAHEIKNPLTPISLCADRIERQLRRVSLPAETQSILNECTSTIQQEVQTVKGLVDEFSQFSRFPAAQPTPTNLNDVVESAMAVFAGRLEGMDVMVDLAPNLPLVMADREQMKRVIVNLIDNAAEAMEASAVRSLLVSTVHTSNDLVELIVADTGCGISALDKERLFLPYFSTKDRGTGLGLAIVSHIIAEHRGRIRVEDNAPAGAKFTVELLAYGTLEPESSKPEAATLPV
jgi:two-component system, NtrC family, nitrogen regulation sensor histidine kinase NtrY